MTKEDLYNQADSSLEFGDRVDVVSVAMLEEFFSQNVCIPKDENVIIQCLNQNLNEWVDIYNFSGTIKYRIKPQEPVYEWRYEVYYANKQMITADYYTDDEIDAKIYSKLNSSKRVRN